MKKLITLFFILSFTLIGQAQVSKTVDISTAGTLSTTLTADELNSVTNLTITGTIDARDFKTMRDNMPALAILDLSGVTIAVYNGTTAYPANEIPEFAFCNPNTWEGKVSLKSVIMPNSVTSIGSEAFESCTELSTVTLPSSLTSIGSEAFEFCRGLSSITIPGSVTSIGSYAFWYCTGLTEFIVDATNHNYSSQDGVLFDKNLSQLIQCPAKKQGTYSMPSSVTSIRSYAFLECTELSSVSISGLVTLIGGYAFNDCTGLISITIPGSVTSIGNAAFINCTGLTDFIVDATNLNYSSQNGVLFDKNLSQLIQCPAKKQGTYSIPSSVTSIKSFAFQYCVGLSNVTIPGSVTSMGENAFYGCTGLSSVTLPGSMTSIGSCTFYGCTGLTSIYAYPVSPVDLSTVSLVFKDVDKTNCTLYVPTESKTAYQAANQWKDFANIVEITTAIPTVNKASISLYPNPVMNDFYVSGINGTALLNLFDINGKMLLNKEVTNNKLISVGTLPKGMYVVKLMTGEGTIERKMVKK